IGGVALKRAIASSGIQEDGSVVGQRLVAGGGLLAAGGVALERADAAHAEHAYQSENPKGEALAVVHSILLVSGARHSTAPCRGGARPCGACPETLSPRAQVTLQATAG